MNAREKKPARNPRRGDTPAAAVHAWRKAGEARSRAPEGNGFRPRGPARDVSAPSGKKKASPDEPEEDPPA